jgi:hypothetical protein
MILKALIVEQLECDGHLKTFEMYAEPGGHMRVAFADESENPRSGPFHFLDRRDERRFEAGFAHCTLWKLSRSKFIEKSGEFVFKQSWRGIPTDQGFLSCYALSLPEFAVPTCVEFKDRHAARLDADKIIRDDQRNRIVLYFECRAANGCDSSFSLHVAFRIDRSDFRNFDSREHNNQLPYEYSLKPEEKLAIVQFLSQEVGALVQTKITPQRVASQEVKLSIPPGSSIPDKLLEKKRDMSEIFDGANLTDKQREVASLAWEHEFPVAAIAKRTGKHRTTIEECLSAAKTKINHSCRFDRRTAKRSTDPE